MPINTKLSAPNDATSLRETDGTTQLGGYSGRFRPHTVGGQVTCPLMHFWEMKASNEWQSGDHWDGVEPVR
jgi:hypothetical protein